jgi:sigma-B regulation protein RsbU (phosphoserine phosphatase)
VRQADSEQDFFSDGVTEAVGPDGFYGDERLVETLRERRNLPLGDLVDQTLASVEAFRGGMAASDDVTLLLVRRRG